MRPTDLHFRSPKEKTAEFLYPVLTSYGKRIPFLNGEKTKGSFSQSRRFPDYEEHARKTGYRVGPGAYETHQTAIGVANIKGTPCYHNTHGGKVLSNNGYIYVGNSIIFEPGLMNKKSQVSNVECTVDASQILTQSPDIKSRKSFQETTTDSFKKVPWFMKFNANSTEETKSRTSSFIATSRKKNDNIFRKILKNSPKFD